MPNAIFPLTRLDLDTLFDIKYRGDVLGWGPKMRLAFGYFNPDDQYEALVNKLVRADTHWLDVGCGRDVFPSNRALAGRLSRRCAFLMGVDPDDTLDENCFVHARSKTSIEDLVADRQFDLVTMRMVAEHIANPVATVRKLAEVLKPGGRLVIYTVNRFSPVPLVTGLIPFALHHPAKRFLWRTERKDTFPTCFRMNTRRQLERLLRAAGFDELAFAYLDDCRTFGRFRVMQYCELSAWWVLHKLRLRYPENCLLGVYRRN